VPKSKTWVAGTSPAMTKDRSMCEECEEAEPLTVAYFGKASRYGWRPPRSAATVPQHRDPDVATPARAFACEPASTVVSGAD
jgi:hypothetical protein